ncbi:Transcription factor lbx1 [Cichlidogyrus casuarinus]|uniref:Transcription factor lbx1 n=1 Tax=Cichlidogyrus casuarinus TaxID=1844966 RepID=A0ABD2QNF7_9PLAT
MHQQGGESNGSGDESANLLAFYSKTAQLRKRRKTRTTFSNSQIAELEDNFSKQKYLTPADRDRIARKLSLSNTQVITWFQNRRAKMKRENEELERDLVAAKKDSSTASLSALALPDEDDKEEIGCSGSDKEDFPISSTLPNLNMFGANLSLMMLTKKYLKNFNLPSYKAFGDKEDESL